MRILATILALLALPSAALAQMPAQSPHGITVNGHATKRVPATGARILLQFSTQQKGLALDATSLAPVIDALVRAGVPRANVTFTNLNGNGGTASSVELFATVDNPTAAQIQTGIATLTATLVGMRDITLGNAEMTLEATDCGSVADSLRTAAIEDARTKAASIAKELGVHLGPVLNVVSTDAQFPNDTCRWPVALNPGSNQTMLSPDDYASVPVNAFINITFAIKP